MEFDNHLSLVQACLIHAKRIIGQMDKLSLEDDFDAVQTVLEKVEACISRFSEKDLLHSYLFLLLNSKPAFDDEDLQDSELGHLLGIAPIISVDVLLAISVEIFPQQNFLFEAISFLPFSLSYELSSSYVSVYVKNDFQKVAEKLDILCCAILYNILNCESRKDFQMFLTLLEMVLICIQEEENKADSFTHTCILKAVLSLIKSSLSTDIPFDVSKWKDFYAKPLASENCVQKNRDTAQKLVIKYASKVFLNISVRSKLETCDKPVFLIQSVRELAYECVALNMSSISDPLLSALVDIAQKPRDVADKIKESSLSSLCSNALIESEDQCLWLKALICHNEGLENEEALNTLHKLIDLFDSDDKTFVCKLFHNFPELRKDTLRDLAIKCLSRLDTECKHTMLDYRMMHCCIEDFFVNENCESSVLEVLNRLVAEGNTCGEEDQLIILAYKSPQLVAKHVLLTAASNKLFSASVVGKILKRLRCVFGCPIKTSFQAVNLTDVILSDFIFKTSEIDKELEGLQNLIKLLLKAELINAEYFLHSCILPPLFVSAKNHLEHTVLRLLQILLDFQSDVSLCKSNVDIPTLLVFLGQLLEWSSRNVSMEEESQGNIVRDLAIRNIQKIFALLDRVQSIQGPDKEWILHELSPLSPENRHYFSALAPEWMLFHGERAGQVVIILAKVLPYLHVSEWHQLVETVPRVKEEDGFESIITFCCAVNLIGRAALHKKPVKLLLNLKSCVRNLGSVIQSCVKNGIDPWQSARILAELLALLERFPKSEQFDVAVFLLPTMMELIDRGCQDGGAFTAVGRLLLETSVQCVRRDLGRHLKNILVNGSISCQWGLK